MRKKEKETKAIPKKDKPTAEDDFYGWAYDANQHRKRKVIISYIVAFVSVMLAAISLSLNIVLLPLKEKIPIVITVAEGTGVVDVSTSLQDREMKTTEAIALAEAAKYVLLRESYSVHTYPENYKKAVTMSVGKSRNELIATKAPDAIESPMGKWHDKAQINIIWNSFNFLSKDIVSVRFVKELITKADPPLRSNFIATLKFEHLKDAKLSLKMRIFNPLAFVVSDYQVNKEGVQ